ncbi:MAG: 8-oxo-dGTP diphosphatase [Anaerolineales bacterium]|nr:8-oxo-dGTP diphosphatase [Anaerolineales bacterium]MDW8447240.1 8-oxo-dGTP diphosphatase [Anaerolineales bacterium]
MKLATLCYLRKDGKTLMIHRIKKQNDIHAGKWNGLGGKFEPGETPEECVRREVYEEAGIRVKRLQLKGFLTFPKFAKDEDWYAFVFVCEEFEGEIADSLEGNLAWIENDKLLELPLWEGDRLFLPLLDQPGFFTGKLVYQDGKLVEHELTQYS